MDLLIKKMDFGWCFLLFWWVCAQNKTGILGTVLDAKTQRPLAYVVVSIQKQNVMQLTAIDGNSILI
jgi:hypothetical protein